MRTMIAAALILLAGPASAEDHSALVTKHASAHGLPEALVHRVIKIESRGNPRLVSKGNYGLMQIRLGTAKAMGYAGGADGLLDADTNMTYAVKYLAGAYRAAGGNPDRAVSYYQRGYYSQAKAKGFSPYQTSPEAAPRAIQVANSTATPDVAEAAAEATTVREPTTATAAEAAAVGGIVEVPSKPRRTSRVRSAAADNSAEGPLRLLAEAFSGEGKVKAKRARHKPLLERGGAPPEPIY